METKPSEQRNLCLELRKRYGLTQEQFSDVLGVSRHSVMRWEAHPEKMNRTAILTLLHFDMRDAL